MKHFIDNTETVSVLKNIGAFHNINLTQSSTGNFLSPIPVSDWLIFCCENSKLYQKKK